MTVKLGINPITWTNDDDPALGGDTPLEVCLSETKAAGYRGTELGGKFPRQSAVLGPILAAHGLELVSGWYDGRICEKSVDEEFEAIRPHLTLLRDLGAKHVVYADTSRGRTGAIFDPISRRPSLSADEWPAYGAKITTLAERMAEFGVAMAFHHHMGTIVETDAEIDQLMARTGEAVGLLFDTGHCAFSGGDPKALLARHVGRVVHVHCKDVRSAMLKRARAEDMSFMGAVVQGIFTVPGDGSIDYPILLRMLADAGYAGWLVVEAEQDPAKAHPLTYATMGYRNLHRLARDAGFTVETASARNDEAHRNVAASGPPMSAVRYEAVEKAFGAFKALHGLDLKLPDRTFLALLGPSGCGKTTALRLLAGLEQPTSGRILIGDRDVTRLQPRDRDVAMVFQTYALYPHMTIAENIGYPLRIRKVGPDGRKSKIAEVSAALEIDHLLDRYPRQLSGGQRQRVALARAIVRDPAAFLMDEPLSNLDARLRLTMRGEIKRLCTALKTTTLYVTHDQAEALTMADLIAVMHKGELQQLAPPNEIYDRPANRFVATFVGNPPMNVLRAAVDVDGLHVGSVTISLDPGRRDACIAAGVAEIGTRPEELTVVEAGTPGAIPGEVYVVEPMGPETFVNLKIGDEHLSLRTGRGFSAPVGSVVGVKLETSKACFFDRTGATVAHRL